MTNIREHVESLPGVKAYYERPDAVKEPHVAIWMSAIKYWQYEEMLVIYWNLF